MGRKYSKFYFIQVKRIIDSHVARLMFKANYCTKNSDSLSKPGLSLTALVHAVKVDQKCSQCSPDRERALRDL